MTQRQFVADIMENIKAINLDDWVSPKFIISEAKTILADFIKKDNDTKKHLYRLSEGWSEIPCLKMTEVPVTECSDIDVKICQKLMKSVDVIPDTYSFIYGNIIKTVSSVNYMNFYDPTTPRQWAAIQKRQYKDKNKHYYFFVNGYIYIPIPKGSIFGVEEIRMEAYFKDKYDVYQFNLKHGNCESCKNECPKALDFDFVIPFYLENDVKKELLNRLSNIYLKVNPDSYPDLNQNPANHTNQRDLQNGANGLT
jgi:hypothetical protein